MSSPRDLLPPDPQAASNFTHPTSSYSRPPAEALLASASNTSPAAVSIFSPHIPLNEYTSEPATAINPPEQVVPGPSNLSSLPPNSPILRKAQSFRQDEGYGEGIEESQSFQDNPNDYSQDTVRDFDQHPPAHSGLGEVRIPPWMMELNDDVRQGMLYLFLSPSPAFLLI